MITRLLNDMIDKFDELMEKVDDGIADGEDLRSYGEEAYLLQYLYDIKAKLEIMR